MVAEPWLLATFDQPFYDQEIRLVVCGYVRPEANFTSLQVMALAKTYPALMCAHTYTLTHTYKRARLHTHTHTNVCAIMHIVLQCTQAWPLLCLTS